jgi:hypothetical protein
LIIRKLGKPIAVYYFEDAVIEDCLQNGIGGITGIKKA